MSALVLPLASVVIPRLPASLLLLSSYPAPNLDTYDFVCIDEGKEEELLHRLASRKRGDGIDSCRDPSGTD